MLSSLSGIKTIVSHGDVDGVACTAIVLRRFPSAKIIFAEPYTINNIIRGLVKPIIVLDIMFNECDGVHVIDHHRGNAPSCTSLLTDWPEASKFLVELGVAGDTGSASDSRILSAAVDLADAIAYDSDDNLFRAYAAKYLSLHEKLPPETFSRAKKFRKMLNVKVEEAKKASEVIGDSLLILYPSLAKGFVSRIAGMFAKKYATVAVVWVNDGKTVVTLRGANAKNIVEFFRNVDPRFCNGGGHSTAASFSTTSRIESVSANVKSILRNGLG
ncbi:MAG: hypothetical protein QXJ62_03845 [Nitrososphaeria archaeon]